MEELLREIEEFLHAPQPIEMHLIASCDRYDISRAFGYIVIEDKHLQVTECMPIIGDIQGAK